MNREDFPILGTSVHNRPLVYLDNAATTQKPRIVLDALTEAYSNWNANVHRGVHHLSQVATTHHEQSRQRVADYLGASDARSVLFTSGTTDSINLLAYSFGEAYVQEGDNIIVSALEHHANIVPWQMLCERKHAQLRVLPMVEDQRLDIDALPSLINDRTRLIAVAHVSNVLGIINPVEDIIRIAHDHHIPVLIDGAQSAAHLHVNVEQLGCDFFACSAHKMYGPTGLGVLYGKPEWLEKMPPVRGGGAMIDHVRWEKTTYGTLPYKFEAGTPNYIGSYAFAKALDYIDAIGRTAIQEYENDLTQYLEAQLAAVEGVHIYAAGVPKAGIVSFNVEHLHPFDVGTLLDQQGVAVRTGHHCAEPLVDYLNTSGTLRASVALYNTREEIDYFIKALNKAISMLR